MKVFFGYLVSLAGLTLALLAVIGMFLVIHTSQGFGENIGYFWITALLFATLGGYVFKLGKRLRALSVENLLKKDSRPPVLYLRSFQDDARADLRSDQNGLFSFLIKGIVAVPQIKATEEEQIAQVMNWVGPFIAIGRPGEVLAQTGAARMYVGDDEWQSIVIRYIEKSCFVLMRAGETEGFWWEIDKIKDALSPLKVGIILPDKQDQWDLFQRRIGAVLDKPLPPFVPKKFGDRSFSGLLYFDTDWTPYIINFDTVFGDVVKDLGDSLMPLFDRLDLAAAGPKAPTIRNYDLSEEMRFRKAPLPEETSTPKDQLDAEPKIWNFNQPLGPASRKIRLLAWLIDVLIMVGMIAIVYAVEYIDLADGSLIKETASNFKGVLILAIFFYFPLMELTPLRGSFGKRIKGLKIFDSLGGPPTLVQVFFRLIFSIAEGIFTLLLLPLILLAFGKPTLSEKISGTRVMVKRLPPKNPREDMPTHDQVSSD